jgi:hypothetical protein
LTRKEEAYKERCRNTDRPKTERGVEVDEGSVDVDEDRSRGRDK